jgi:hypothetical protein
MTYPFMAVIVVLWAGICLGFAPWLYRCWREPVLMQPVFILESDDWGAGPLEQAGALDKLHNLLLRFQDSRGSHPVMTIGVILALADTARIRAKGGKAYHAVDLTCPEFAAIREQLIIGKQAGVYALQLHGKEHYWPGSLMRAAQTDPDVYAWLTADGIPQTERLPSHLQARWTDASVLPSRPHPKEHIEAAVVEEVKLFESCLGDRPRVAVATTFVWNADVERVWAEQGIDTVITPGKRHTLRDAQGRPGGVDKIINNGDFGEGGQIYLSRDIYFEPSLGHDAKKLVDAAIRQARLGCPILVEMHRYNFLGDDERVNASLKILEDGMAGVLRALPDVRFMSSARLAEVFRRRDATMVERSPIPRLRVWLRRIDERRSFKKITVMSGLAAILWLLRKALRA